MAAGADAHGARGAALIEQARALQAGAMAAGEDRFERALALYREALDALRSASALRPGSAQAHRLCGVALREMGDLEGAREEFAAACAIAPQDAQAAADHASCLQALGDTQGALAAYAGALARDPDSAVLHAGLALSLLGAGDFGRGWDEYEWRARLPDARRLAPPWPAWGGEPLAGKSLFVASEQGIGDEIMFASCLPDLLESGARCVLEASRRLAPLFRRSFPAATVVERDLAVAPEARSLPPIDRWTRAGSLPRWLRRSPLQFPARERYLAADATRAAQWRGRVEALGAGLKVGLAWTGGLPQTLRASRSLALDELAPVLAVERVRFVALERTDPRASLQALPESSRPAWWPLSPDLDDWAALVDSLDLVVSVTTATAHLAAALGRPTWILVPGAPTWRYGWSGERMPWYPAARILRNAPGRPRSEFSARVARELALAVRRSGP